MFDKKVTALVVTILAALNLLVYVSMRTVLAFIGYYMNFMPIIYIFLVILIAAAVLSLINLLHKHNKKLLIALFVISAVFLVALIGFFAATAESYTVYLLESAKMLLVYAIIAIIVYLIFYFPKSKFYTKTIASIVCAVLVFGVIIGLTDVKKLQINYINTGAAVYVVEDEYQIVWTTKNQALGWVEVGGERYYDEIAGSLKSTQTVHKVSVPQTVLDQAKSYTVHSQTMINEEAYFALKGRTFSKTYNFRPVDDSDGVQYYVVSDTHNINQKGISAASYYGDDADFIVMAGDFVSFIDTKQDLERIASLAHGLTDGNIPIVFTRGNHEVKGRCAESLYKYVGANSTQGYYYTFRLGSVWGVVLDMGESHADGWKENFGTANFTPYRNAQLDMLDDIVAAKEDTYQAEGITHRLAVSHINTSFVHDTHYFLYELFVDFNQRLNQIGLDIMVSGHKHEVFHAPKGMVAGTELRYVKEYSGAKPENVDKVRGIAAGAMYDTLICAIRNDEQFLGKREKLLGKRYTGTALHHKIDEAGDGVLEVRFTTNRKKVLNTINPFTGESLGSTIYIY